MTLRRFLAVALPVVVVLSVAIGGVTRIAWTRYDLDGPLMAPTDVLVPRGGPAQIGETLATAGVIRDATEFRVAALVTRGDGPLHAGEFTFPPGAKLRDVLAILRTAHPTQHRLTIPEGLTAAQIAMLLQRADALAGETPIPEEGGVLPNTYAFDRGATRDSVLARATSAMERALADAWEGRAANLPLSSAQQLLTLASIVERETSHAAERPHVAAVYLNRLRLGMKLQADPTVAYAVSGGADTNDRGLTRVDLERDNPYNTYRVPGLPPGPIDSPGVASLQAVAHPAESDDLFFVADGTGGHLFARTNEEHDRNVAHWRAMQRNEIPRPPVPSNH